MAYKGSGLGGSGFRGLGFSVQSRRWPKKRPV
jgi:hypothetical protein